MDSYAYSVTWSSEERQFVGLCSEMPLLSHFDETREAALQGITHLVAGIVADMTEKGEAPPEPHAPGLGVGTSGRSRAALESRTASVFVPTVRRR